MKEYGSNIQKIVDYIVAVPDRDTRTKQAHILIELMRQIHPQMRDGIDYSKKLWDDLYIMANFDLDVDSPFPPPPKEILGKKPMTVPYNQHRLKYLHYGRNLELLVLKAILTEGEEDRRSFVSYIVKLMKTLYLTWNKDSVETHTCLDTILQLSGFRLQAEVDYLRQNGIYEDANPKDGTSNGNRQRANFDGGQRKPNQQGFIKRNNNNTNGNPNNGNNKNRRFKDKRRR